MGPTVEHAVGAADKAATAQIAQYKAAAAAAQLELQTSNASLAAAVAEVAATKAREAAASEAHSAIIRSVTESEETHMATIKSIESGLHSHRESHATALETLKRLVKALGSGGGGRGVWGGLVGLHAASSDLDELGQCAST